MVAEVALGSVVFFALLLAIFDFGRMYHCQSRLKFAVSQATRFATTGNTVEDPSQPGQQLSRAASIKTMIRQLSGYEIPDADIDISSIDGAGATVPGAGGPGDVVSVTSTDRVDVVAPLLSSMFEDGRDDFSATTSFRNEEFPQARIDVIARTAWA